MKEGNGYFGLGSIMCIGIDLVFFEQLVQFRGSIECEERSGKVYAESLISDRL